VERFVESRALAGIVHLGVLLRRCASSSVSADDAHVFQTARSRKAAKDAKDDLCALRGIAAPRSLAHVWSRTPGRSDARCHSNIVVRGIAAPCSLAHV
jgi:hypothetical protein